MTDARDRIRGQMQTLEEELRTIRPASWNHQRISDRRHMLELLQMQLDRIERMHKTFFDYRATLAARFHAFAANGGGR